VNITLLDGRVIDLDSIEFDSRDYSFRVYYADGSGTENITTLVRNVDKRRFADFDNDFYNQLLYVQNYRRTHGGANPPQVGSDSFWANFVEQMKDPLAAPLESLDNVVSDLLASTGVQTILLVGGVALILVILAKR
jgi:hypothetical protein